MQVDRAEGRRSRRAGRRRRRRAAPAGRRRSGHDLQRSRRAVRSAPARAADDRATTAAAVDADGALRSRLGSVRWRTSPTSRRASAPSDINRLARQRQVTIVCNLLPGASQADVQTAIAERSSARLRPSGDYRGGLSGPIEGARPRGRELHPGVRLSLIFMYLILAAQFESWLHPITILLSLPLTLPFALLSIIIFQQSLNIFSALGHPRAVRRGEEELDSADRSRQPAARERGLSTHDAIIQASRDRLRPILMTTFAFVAGMVPLIVVERRRAQAPTTRSATSSSAARRSRCC